MFTASLALAAVVAMASAQSCAGPKEFEARVVAFDPNHGRFRNHTEQYFVRARLAFSEEKRARHIIEDAVVGNHFEALDILELYDDKKVYVTNIRTRECQVHDLDFPFKGYGSFGNFSGFVTIGAEADEHVTLSQFDGDDEERHFHSYQTFTAKSCVPVRRDFFDETGFHYEEIEDIRLEVRDPHEFDPPANCH